MLDRPALKTAAKLRMMRPGFRLIWYSLFVMIAANAPSYIIQFKMPALNYDPSAFSSMEQLQVYFEQIYESVDVPLTAIAVLLVYRIFVSVIQAGYRRTCLMVARGEDVAFRDIFDTFGYWIKIIGMELLIGIVTALGTIAFIVPGIILSYSYSQALFILIDNPDMGIIEAMHRSRILMSGHKIEFFVFQLSYFLWYMLSSFIILADLYVMPYVAVGEALYYEYVSGHQVFVFSHNFGQNTDEEKPDDTEDIDREL